MKRLLYLCLSIFAVTMAEERNLDQVFSDGNNQFTAKMFYEVTKSNPGKSVVLSAFSVMPSLAQLALASIGESHDELLDAIGMPNDNVTKEAFSLQNSKLRSMEEIVLKTANKIYVAEGYELNDDFVAVSRDAFGSEVKNINFNKTQEAADEVNAWVEEQTEHRIKDLVNPAIFTIYTRALLVNAIYFKGIWKEPFSKYTTARDFYVTKDKVIKVPTMYSKKYYNYLESKELKAQILEISYEGDEASCIFILPRDVDGINDLQEKLRDPKILNRAIKNMEKEEVKVYLPKFNIETTTNLKDILQKINVSSVFSPASARLYNLLKTTEDLYVDSALQKAFIDIDEEGAEAAAAEYFSVSLYRSFLSEPVVFKADHPFMFYIYSGDNILFNGVYYS